MAFLVWGVFVGLLGNFLKPPLLGRGVRVPMVVIFVGAMGGLLASGIIGLFVGSARRRRSPIRRHGTRRPRLPPPATPPHPS